MRRWAIMAAALIALAAIAWRLSWQPAGSRLPRLDTAVHQPPVLMIHGSGMGSSSWDALIRHLRTAGWPEEYLLAVDLIPHNGANIPAAENQLLPAARRLLALAGARAEAEGRARPQKIAMVAHSMGAVSGRWLAAKLIPEAVESFIALAGANHGSDALCGLPGEGDRELCPAFPVPGKSGLLDALNGTEEAPADETPYGPSPDPPGVTSVPPTQAACIAWYSIMIDPDEWVVPAASARLTGSGGAELKELPSAISWLGPGAFLVKAPADHDDLPAVPAVKELVTSLLRKATAACPWVR